MIWQIRGPKTSCVLTFSKDKVPQKTTQTFRAWASWALGQGECPLRTSPVHRLHWAGLGNLLPVISIMPTCRFLGGLVALDKQSQLQQQMWFCIPMPEAIRTHHATHLVSFSDQLNAWVSWHSLSWTFIPSGYVHPLCLGFSAQGFWHCWPLGWVTLCYKGQFCPCLAAALASTH